MFWRIAAIGACYVYALTFFQSWLQTYLVRGHGYTEAALILSSLPYVIGGIANGRGGLLSDWLVRRLGLRRGTSGALVCSGWEPRPCSWRRPRFTSSGAWALGFLSLAYAGILLQQPNICAVCLDTGRKHAGAVFGFMNTAANAACGLSSVAFGYIVTYFGSYNAPFFPMVATLCVGALLWLTVDATQDLFEEEQTPVAVPGLARAAFISCSRGPLSLVLGHRFVPWSFVLGPPWTEDLGLWTDHEPSAGGAYADYTALA